MFLELEAVIFILSIEILKDPIFILLFDNYTDVKSWKVISLLLELEGIILTLSLDILESFIFVLLLKFKSEKREKTAKPDSHTIDIWLLQK